MRNLFDQYDEPENQLSHALASCLAHDSGLLQSFLRWVGCLPPSGAGRLTVTEQRLPGDASRTDDDEDRGLPDICIYTADLSWALLVESKVQARLELGQLVRHRRTAERRGVERSVLLTITKEPPRTSMSGCLHKTWTELYSWARRERRQSEWARCLGDYLEVAETKMAQTKYLKEGSLTVFDGIYFDAQNRYNYGEAKRLLRLMMGELRKRKDLLQLGMNPNGDGRPAITGKETTRVWDFIPLHAASGATFTRHPHLTLSLHESSAFAMITLPNGARAQFRKNLVDLGLDGFRDLIEKVAARICKATRSVPNARPQMYALQRHFRSQKSEPEVDGEVWFDLRTAGTRRSGAIKVQRQWIDAVYSLLSQRRSNLQFGIGAALPYGAPAMREKGVLDLVAGAWLACGPWMVAMKGEHT